MLRALRRLLRRGGRMAFLAIHLAPGLTGTQRRRARAAGPRAVATRGDHRSMLQRAGFTVDVERDVTATFLDTARSWLTESEEHAETLEALEPAGGFDERQRDRRAMIAAIEDGLLRRSLFVATS